MSSSLLRQYLRNVSRGPDHEADRPGMLAPVAPAVRLIAFYLPQFHAIPENDRWWGAGFTEWTNVTKALPRFEGHYQPRLPADLGFYDLAHSDALQRQAVLARRYGIAGFCFHHYWFAGQRLLQTPLDNLLAHPEIDLPFCVNWANESWTRRWDGSEHEVLMEQRHSPEDDIAFAASLEPLFRDPRYIKVDGRPLLMLYRPGILPDAAATVRRWRAHFIAAGLGDPYVVMAQAFNDGDPAAYGMDAAAGFPPFWAGHACPRIGGSQPLLDPEFGGEVIGYEAMAAATVASWQTDAKLFPGVCPAWDNQARRPGGGFCFTGSSPELYGRWLRAACRMAARAEIEDERLVFINAWNEWAEGAYLEPDRHYGFAYLAETARVLGDFAEAAGGVIGPGAPAQAGLPALAAESTQARARRVVRRLVRRGADTLADTAEGLARRLRGP